MKPLSLGKIRCLQQLSNRFGVFTVAALDHRDVFVDSLSQTFGVEQADWDTVVAEKIRIAKALAPYSSAVLLDPLYSVGPVIANNILPAETAFAAALEKSSYSDQDAGRTTILADWSVEAIKRIGGSAIKLLLFYHPDSPTAATQEDVVCQVAAECETYEIPLLLEPICYPLTPGQKKTDVEFAAQRPKLVLESARRLLPLGVDILKAEFPTDAAYESDEEKMANYCRQLTQISGHIPWVLLSAGVDFPTFQRQLEIACQAGASGFVAGRAIWKESLEFGDVEERNHFLTTTAVSRTRVLSDIANYRATPWSKCCANRMPHLTQGWYVDYNKP